MFGLGRQKPHHDRRMVPIVWENRAGLPFARDDDRTTLFGAELHVRLDR
jgi:hypothetical protein